MNAITHNNAHIMRNIEILKQKIARLTRAEASAKVRLLAASAAADKARGQVNSLYRERTFAESDLETAEASLLYCELTDAQLETELVVQKMLTSSTTAQIEVLRQKNRAANGAYTAIEDVIRWRENLARKQEEGEC